MRFPKIKDYIDHEWLYSQLVLYHPSQTESVDLKEAMEDKKVFEDTFLYPSNPDLISENDEIRNSNVIKVRRKVMPFLEDVEEV